MNISFEQLEFNKNDDVNEQFRVQAKLQGQCACRLWLILFLVNFAIINFVTFLILLLLIEVGPVRKWIGRHDFETCSANHESFRSE